MSVPAGYMFRPTDQELVIDFLRKKSKGAEALPCNVVFEREIYGTGNKAPWQIFTKNDPWEEGSVYVLTKLIKARSSDKRIARTAGCGSWHGETGPEPIYDEQTGPDDEQTDPELIGYKRMLRFQITNELGVMDESMGKGFWTMREFSLQPDDSSRDTKIVKCTKKSTRKAENVEAVATSDADVIMVRKPAKHARKEEFHEQEQKVEALETENIVPYSQELLEAEKEGHYSQMLSDVDADLEQLRPMLESEQLASICLDFDASDPRTLSWLPPTPFSEEFSKAEE
ncbi:NAC domain-containing protein 37-like [Rhododendron vialii]|uniref:NAC domain-containing protein 37-like n=1 Tax=Rhododendron vialii TaxID=182163 RepID=UPI0026603777|nr:NAC domain-containing protein 37-like [Rhododendron vialii]